MSITQRQVLEVRVDQDVVQAGYLLQCSRMELEGVIEQELIENPALERIESAAENDEPSQPFLGRRGLERVDDTEAGDPVDTDDPEANVVDRSLTLREYLSRELYAQLHEEQYPIADYLLDNLDERGLLPNFDYDRASLETGASPEEIEAVLRVLQSLDPPGIGARSLQECMLLQLRDLREQGKGNLLAERIVEKYLLRLDAPPVRQMARELKASVTEVEQALKYIREALHPYPAYRFRLPWGTPPQTHQETLRPDVIIRRNPHAFEVEVVRPRWILIISPKWREQYEKIKANPSAYPEETVKQVREYVERAEKFLHHLELRYRTLHRITRLVIDHQFAFLETGLHTFLRPLTRAQIAAQLGIHESTVSRAIANKWVLIPNDGLIPFSDFFTPSLSIQKAIVEVVNSEDPYHPYSDQQIADILYQRWGIRASRRTVVKYRNRMHIPPSRSRRKRI
ncbi:MAG: RNA polymerase factor sigma-54 [bacterium]|nr:RNA polymerase factor sigma-54 [bacterium]